MSKKRVKKDGWAITKWKHHKNHPAYYRKKGTNKIEYVTFTSSKVVDFGDEKIVTQPLKRNINKDFIKDSELEPTLKYEIAKEININKKNI